MSAVRSIDRTQEQLHITIERGEIEGGEIKRGEIDGSETDESDAGGAAAS